MSQDKDPNQGEGDRISARRYDRNVREFIDEGRVPDAANDARQFVDRDPDEALKAEQAAKRGPSGHHRTVDELLAKGQSVVDRLRTAFGSAARPGKAGTRDRLRPRVDRALGSLRARFGRK
jgi:hypothetical protein